jgi:hypothetical protein
MSRGGARWGAGRPATKAQAEQLARVDVRLWAAQGLLKKEARFNWSWTRGGTPSGSVSVWVTPPHGVTLQYMLTVNGDQRTVTESITLDHMPCRFGGTRPWFRCPLCAMRVAVLYLRRGRFACRHCQRVAYASQSEDELGRAWRKQSRLEARLGDHWTRPKGMRLRTYQRLFKAVIECEQKREDALAVFAARLFGLDR